MSPVRDFVRDVWKIATGCAGGAFLLSLVIGLFARNPGGVAVFRALLLAVLFAGLGVALRFVVKAYLPELASTPGGLAGANASPAGLQEAGADISGEHRGAAVDIVLQDDEGLRRQAYGESTPSPRSRPQGTGAANAEDVGDEALEASLDADFMTQGDPPGLAELAEELPPAQDRSAGAGASGSASDEGALEEMESGDELPRAVRGAHGGQDALPDIDGLETGPAPKPARTPPRLPRPAAGEKPGDAVRNALSGQDPSTLARAIRTVLKNAEKG